MDLVPTQRASLGKGEADVWSWRDRLPADVLREITSDAQSYRSNASEGVRLARVLNGDFTSAANVGAGDGFSRTQANLFGTLPGSLQYSFRGSYANLRGADATPLSQGKAADAVLLIAGSPDTAVALTYSGHDFTPAEGDSARMEREAIRFDHQSESAGRFEWSVSRRTESGFERATSVIPDRLPAGGEDDDLRGRWSRDNDNARAGITLEVYRRTISAGPQPGDGTAGSLLDAGLSAAAERPVAGPLSAGAQIAARAGSSGSAIAPGPPPRRPGRRASVISGAPRVGDCPEPSLRPGAESRFGQRLGLDRRRVGRERRTVDRGHAGRIGPDPREFHPHRRPAAGLFRRRPAARRLQHLSVRREPHREALGIGGRTPLGSFRRRR
jgi:hypothetical protein